MSRLADCVNKRSEKTARGGNMDGNRRETCDCLSSLKGGLLLTETVMGTDSTSQRDSGEEPAPTPPNSQGRSKAGLGRTVLRLLAWTVVGTVAGFCFMPLTSLFERYHAIGSVLNALMLPAQGMFAVWVSFGFGPHGDAGFIMIFVFMVVEWALAGFLFGVGRTWYLRRKGRDEMTAARTPKRKKLLYAALPLVLVVGGYFVWQEVLIAKDRNFFLSQVNYKEFAEASLDMVVNPDKYGLSLGRCKGTDPKLPEAIRNLKTENLDYHGYSVRVCNFYFQGLAFSHSMKDPTRYEVVFERNYREPVVLYSMQSTNLPKIDWH